MIRLVGRAFYDAAIGMAVVGLDGRFIHVNKSLCDMIEYSEEELLTKKFQDITHPDDIQKDVEMVEKCIAKEIETYRMEKRYITKSGKTLWILLTVSITNREDTRERCFISQIQDINDLKHYREMTAAALEAGGIGIWTWYAKNNLLTWNDTMFRIFNANNQAFTGKCEDFIASIHPDDRYLVEPIFQDSSLPTFAMRLRVLLPHGKIGYIAFKGKRRFTNNLETEAISGICYDITKVIENEINIARSNEELEHFAFAISHDLQEPLRTITSFVSLARKNEKKHANSQTNRYLDLIETSANRAKSMISDLLEFSRAASLSEDSISEIEPAPIIHDICKSLSASIKEKGANIVVESTLKIKMETYHFSMIMQNLISNSIKYAKDEEPPQISINMSSDDREWTIVVEDNGIGIEQKNIERLFKPFVRVGPKSKDGTGLGLALCKKIVSLYFGKIWITSSVNQGSKVYITIPKNYEEAKKSS